MAEKVDGHDVEGRKGLGKTGAVEEGVHRTADLIDGGIDRLRVTQVGVQVMGDVDPRRVDVEGVDLATELADDSRRRLTHPRGGAGDDDPLAGVGEDLAAHVLVPTRPTPTARCIGVVAGRIRWRRGPA